MTSEHFERNYFLSPYKQRIYTKKSFLSDDRISRGVLAGSFSYTVVGRGKMLSLFEAPFRYFFGGEGGELPVLRTQKYLDTVTLYNHIIGYLSVLARKIIENRKQSLTNE